MTAGEEILDNRPQRKFVCGAVEGTWIYFNSSLCIHFSDQLQIVYLTLLFMIVFTNQRFQKKHLATVHFHDAGVN